MASFGLARDSSIVFPWLAMSRSEHHATYRFFRDASLLFYTGLCVNKLLCGLLLLGGCFLSCIGVSDV